MERPSGDDLPSGSRRALRNLTGDWPRTTRPLPWCLAAFMAMLWLLPFDSISLPVALPLEAKLDRPFLVLIVALWILSLTLVGGARRVRLSVIHYAFAAFIVVAVLSLVNDAEATVRLGDFDLGVRKLALLVSYFALFVVVASSVRPREVRPFMDYMCGLAVLMALGTIWEYREGFNVFFEWTRTVLPVQIPAELGAVDSIGRRAVIGPTIHPLAPAMMMAVALPYALLRTFESRGRRRKLVWGAAVAIMVAAALATQRKTSIVAPTAALVVLVAYRPRILRRLVPAAVGLFLVVHLIAPGATGGVGEQLLPQRLFSFSSTLNRESDYAAIEPDVIDQPLLGRGYGTYDQKKYRILDNQFLTTIIGTGIAGTLLYVSIFAAIFLLAHRVARRGADEDAPAAIAIAAATVAMLVGSGLLDLFALPQLPYMLCFFAGFAAVLARRLEPEPGRAAALVPARAPRREATAAG